MYMYASVGVSPAVASQPRYMRPEADNTPAQRQREDHHNYLYDGGRNFQAIISPMGCRAYKGSAMDAHLEL